MSRPCEPTILPGYREAGPGWQHKGHSTPDPETPPEPPAPNPLPDDVPAPAHAPVEEPFLPDPPIKAG